jgi:hypothetical protein
MRGLASEGQNDSHEQSLPPSLRDTRVGIIAVRD